MKIKFKVVYKDTYGNYKTIRFSSLKTAETYAEGMGGIVLHVK